MATKKRKSDSSIEQSLLEEPYRYNFFKAVHLLESFSGGKAQGRNLSPTDDPVRFRVEPGFAFPASDISALQKNGNGHALQMTANFMGLIGPKGVLPDWYNEYAQNLKYKKDHSLTDFLDMFHHRLISLFYLAWKKYRLTENYQPDGSDPIASAISGFVGIDDCEREADPAFLKYAKQRLTYFSGLVSRTIPAASAIETLVGHATGVQAQVEQFVERLIPIHEHDRTCLGKNNSTLKKDALCGRQVRDISSYFRVDLGPMSWKKYLAFQPRSRNLSMVRKLIAYIAGVEYEFEIRLILKGPEIPGLCLGGRKGPPILGRTVLLRHALRPYGRNVVVKVPENKVWD